MDTTETYIKMCQKAEEIQAKWHKLKGDYYARYNTGKSAKPTSIRCDVFVSVRDRHREVIYYQGDNRRIPIWLPRQDQLQEMLESNLWVKTLAFEFFLRKEGKYDINKYPYQFTSMEQLWLAFVMKKKFGKVWDNGDWVKR